MEFQRIARRLKKALLSEQYKEIQTLNDTIDQLDLIDIYRTFHSTMNFTFFSTTQKTFSKIDHILGYKSTLGKLKKKIFQASFLITVW